jgi:hypothetical protein
MTMFIELPVLQRAMEEVFGVDAAHVRLRDISAFTDDALNSLVERVRDELMRPQASPLFVQALAQALAVHLARNYGVTDEESQRDRPLPERLPPPALTSIPLRNPVKPHPFSRNPSAFLRRYSRLSFSCAPKRGLEQYRDS